MKKREKWTSSVPAWPMATQEERVLLDAAWRAGELTFLLTPSQQECAKQIERWEKKRSLKERIFAVDSSRRYGKSYILVERGLRKAIQRKGARIVYVAPTYDQVEGITLPIFSDLLRSCPPSLRPVWVKSESTWTFGNGARIELVGLDKNPDAARGSGADDVLLDECGFFLNLEYVLMDVLWPQMLGRPWASVVAASSPSETPMHYWSREVVPACINRGAHTKRTLDDADQYDPEEIEAFWEAMGGRDSVRARRELGAEHIADESLAIVPEFREAEESIIREVEPPVWRDCYVAMDPGFHDMSAVLFGYWHFIDQRLVIEDEILAARLNSGELAAQIKAKEAKLWGGIRRRGPMGSYSDKPQPYLRISDIDPRLLADLAHDHGLTFVPTRKDDLKQQVNRLRVAIQTGRIVIHPRCKKLALHLKMGVWRKIGKLFDREDEQSQLGHYDGIAALVYLWRNVNTNRNPVPLLERYVCGDLRVDNDNASMQGPTRSKWEQVGEKMRRKGQRYFVRTGKRTA